VIRNWMKQQFQRTSIRLSGRNSWQRHHPWPHQSIPMPRPQRSERVRELLRARHFRADLFGARLLADPAWDILLLAYVAALEHGRLLMADLCRAGLVPVTTTVRWAKTLEKEGWLTRSSGPIEDPQSWLELSPKGRRNMERYLTFIESSRPA